MENEDIENVHHNSESQSSECLPPVASPEICEGFKPTEISVSVDTPLDIVGSSANLAESSFIDEIQSQALEFDHLISFSDHPGSHEDSIFSVEQYDNPCLSRRGPGRPRKDGGRIRISQGKLKRGPGRPRKEDGSGILHHKIFTGRPRVRARKMHRHMFGPPGSNFTRPFPHQEDQNFIEGSESSFFSGSSTNEMKPMLPEKVITSKFNKFTRPRRTCSLCNLGEISSLGQGRLKNHHATSGVISKCSPDKTASSEEKLMAHLDEKSPLKLALKKHKPFKSSRDRIRIQRNKTLHGLQEKSNMPTPAEELAAIGFLPLPSSKRASGETLVHYNCAAWSGCIKEAGHELTNIDDVVLSAITQKCHKCQRYGASVHCSVPDCAKIYHFPCATVSGALQDAKNFRTVCVQHINQALDIDITCSRCKTTGDRHQLLLCGCCKNHFHGNCIGIAHDVNPLMRAGWQCMDCKMCQTCKQPGDENKMLVCESCDKKYHTFCLKPTVSSIPKSGWKCHDCRVCGDCGARTPGSGPSSRWHLKYSLCDSCYQQRNKGIACPLCGKAYRQFSRRKEMKHCSVCRKYIHVECDRRVLDIKDPSEYVCPVCANPSQDTITSQDMGNVDAFLKEVNCMSAMDVYDFLGKSPEAITTPDFYIGSSRDSFPSANEDSCSSADSDSTSADMFAIGMDDPSPDLLNIPPSVPSNYLEHSPSRYSHHRDFSLSYKTPGKKRLGVGRPKGGGKLAGKRRAKTAEFRRKRGPKPKIKTFAISGALCLPSSIVDTKECKQDDEPSADNKMVLASASDQYVLCQDLCVMCGSFGKDEEGRLIACSQCGQCYHSYCASIKVTKVILKKGWRCLDCTVCEGCGQPHDEGRLLLCDDCDISFHIYCLDPPLEDVPQGNWKCKWCVACVKCGTREPGYGCSWQINYTHCGPCASYYNCPICMQNYEENELIIQCTQCERWIHGRCDQIDNEESAEKCAEYGYVCLLCRPPEDPPPHMLPPSAPPSPIPVPIVEKPPSPVPKPKEPEVVAVKVKPQTQFYLDGVCLSENGLHYIKSLTPEQPKKIRARRPRQPSVGATAAAAVGINPVVGYSSLSRPDKMDDTDMLASLFQGSSDNIADVRLDMEIKQEIDEEGKIISGDLFKDSTNDPMGEKKKRPRKVPKLGIGGFVVKPRGRSSSTKEASGEHGLSFFCDVANDSNQPSEAVSGVAPDSKDQSSQEKPKRRRKVKKRTPLEECFPSYMQDAFFGKELLQSSKDPKQVMDPIGKGESTSEDSLTVQEKNTPAEVVKVNQPAAKVDLKFIPTPEEPASFKSSDSGMKVRTISVTSKEPVTMPKDVTIEDVKDLLAWSSDVPSQDNIMNVLSSSKDLSGKAAGDSEIKAEKLRDKNESVISFSAAISGSKMSTELDDTGLPQMDIKDVEDVFEGVLRDQKIAQPNLRLKEATGNQPPNYSTSSESHISVAQLQNPSPFALQRSTSQLVTQASISRESVQSAHQQDSNSSWPECESEHSQIQKSIVKWESDEPLGALSTISPVLYANINFPNLKLEHPNWSDRVKQIAKIWRSLPSDKRQPYLQKARDNRAASRNQKSSADKKNPEKKLEILRVNMDGDKGMKDLKVMEIDQEKQWKQLQALRQKQQRILQEQRAQVLLKAQTDKVETFGDLEKAQAACVLRTIPESASARNDIPQDPLSSAKELQYSQLFAKKWNVDTAVPKAEELQVSPQLLPQNNQGIPDSPTAIIRPSLPVRPPTAIGSPFIQVSRVRPPIDPNRIPITDSSSLQSTSLSGTSTEHYHPAQSLLAGHSITSPQRSNFSPNSPVPRQSLLISRTEISRAPTPTLHKEILYTPPSTPRPQSSDSFFQVSVSPRTQFIVSLDSHTQTSIAAHKLQNVPPSFQQSNLESCAFSTASNISTYSTSDSTGVTSSTSHIVDSQNAKPLLSQPAVSAILQNKIATQTVNASTSAESNLKMGKMPNTPTTDHFVQQQQSLRESSVDQNIALTKQIVQHKTELYTQLPGASLPTTSLAQERTIHPPTLEQLYGESQALATDQSKILARHQLRDLLQKQQGSKGEGTVLQISGKDAGQLPLQQWQPGVYNAATLQYVSKDDCFRHPYPPAARARSLSAKDLKGDYPSDILVGSPGDVKINSPNIDISAVEDKNNHHSNHPNPGFISVGLGSTAADSSKISTSVIAEALKRAPTPQKIELPENVDPICSIASGNIRMLETITISRSSESCKNVNVSNTPCIRETNQPRDSNESDFLPVRIKHEVSTEIPSSPGAGKKRKTTAGDLVKDLETQPEEHDVITSDMGEELDDDELLGLGNDFNILEYADPELDKGLVGEGEKSNILDEHLDLDDKDDELAEEEEEEIKTHGGDKSFPSRQVPVGDKKDFIGDNKDEKSNSKCEPQSDLQDDFLDFHKKEDNKHNFEGAFKLKGMDCEVEKPTVVEATQIIKKEPKLPFSSCSVSGSSFCSAEELLKSDKIHIKDSNIQTQSSLAFSPSLSLSPHHPPQAYPPPPSQGPPPPPPSYRIGSQLKQTITSTSPHLPPNQLLQDHKNVFPIHVGVSLRPNLQMVQQNLIASTQQPKPLLLQEQPLLLEDLVEQEKREQRRQTQEGLISPQGDALLSDIDFERLKDDVFSGPPDDSIGGPGSLLSSHESPLQSVVSPSASASTTNNASSHNYAPPPYSLVWQNQDGNISCTGPSRAPAVLQAVQPRAQMANVINSLGLPPSILLQGEPPLRPPQPQKAAAVQGGVAGHPLFPNFLPTPPTPPLDPITEQEKQQQLQYEKWLIQQQGILSSQQKYFETEVFKLRKMKKALNAKQRQLRKNGAELAENDALELAKISQEQGGLQKQLDQVRKQSRQHATLLQEYRLKQQKRQQQQLSQAQIHASLSSLQSSPQSSHSPHQINQAAPHSPMLPTSPMGPSPSARIQHSPSPMMHHSPAAVPPSTIIQQTSPLLPSPLIAQQMSLHFPTVKTENKTWCNPLQAAQISDESISLNERFQQREHAEKFQGGQPPQPSASVTMTLLTENESKESLERKQKAEQELSFAKRLQEQAAASSALPNVEEQNSVLKKIEIAGQGTDRKSETPVNTESPVPASILAQSLPSSVTNTLNFTLRQTGMPTVCLPSGDQSSADMPSQVHYLGLSPSDKISVSSELKALASDAEVSRPETSNGGKLTSSESQAPAQDLPRDILLEAKAKQNIVVSDGRSKLVTTAVNQPSETISRTTSLDKLLNPAISECSELMVNVPIKDEFKKTNMFRDCSLTQSQMDHKVELSMQVMKAAGMQLKEGSASNLQQKSDVEQVISLPAPSKPETTQYSLVSSSQETRTDIHIQDIKNIKLERTDEEYESHIRIQKVKKELLESVEEGNFGNSICLMKESKNNSNDGASSDEELENLAKAVEEGEQDSGKQNVLLKQLLQNCPSAETSRKSDPLTDSKKEEIASGEVPLDASKDQSEKKTDEAKVKKPTYLDIRRAQLEKEPTPPPGEAKPKRKRPKKKKPDNKEGSPVKKRCRKGSSSKTEEGCETYIETLMTQLTSLPPLRILEPNIKPNFNGLPVSAAGDLNVTESRLKGSYGNALAPQQPDVYCYYPYSENHPSPTATFPPSSPPYRGFYNQEFSNQQKSLARNETSSSLAISHKESFKCFRDTESPDTVISSSSPECCMMEPFSKWPELIFIDECITPSKDEKKSYSPVIPLVTPIPIRLVPCPWGESRRLLPDYDKEKDKENIPSSESKPDMPVLKSKMTGLGGYSAPLKDSGNVAVTLTLSSAAAEDICGVLSALADLLKIPIPATYEIVERTATPPSQKLGLYRKSKNSDVNIHSLLNGKPCFCRHCDIVVLSAGIRKKASDLTCISREEQEEDEVIFCSTNCYMQFALTHRSTSGSEEKEAAAIVTHTSEKKSSDKDGSSLGIEATLKAIANDDQNLTETSDSELHPREQNGGRNSSALNVEGIQPETSESNSLGMDKAIAVKSELVIDDQSNLSENLLDQNSHLVAAEVQGLRDEARKCSNKKWKFVKYKYWSPNCGPNNFSGPKGDPEQVTNSFYHIIKPSQMPIDLRKCLFCHGIGDCKTNGPARLLNIDVDKWVHLNCALWSAEVYETVNGALMNVETAYKRAMILICSSCHKQGASLKCFKVRCPNTYHFACAMKEHCAFFKDKTLLCPQHVARGSIENELESVAVFRRVYVNRDEHKQVASMVQGDQYVMRIGSLIFLNIGQLLPTQIQAFHTPNCIYPVGYKIIRMYWSMRQLGRRCQYVCSINEVNGKPEFHIQVKEMDFQDIVLKDKTAKGVWQKVIYPIEKMRKHAKTIKIFPDFITGDDLFGLTEPAVLRIVESLPGVDTLSDYNFRYGRSPFLELPLAINPTGCARSEPKLRTHFKRPHTLHTSNTSRSSFHSTFGGMEVSSPYIKQFVHSKSSQYRKMKTEWRNNVYLARSRIQGLGLYAARDIEKHTMVIEYIGHLIRNEIAERNEAIYDTQNRGVYMFRLDENRVIDATLSGGLARYMNHSCYPNCVAEVVQIDRENKILIIANRRITRGEELTYDYKFEVEDDQHKIPCLCGAPNCRKWMN